MKQLFLIIVIWLFWLPTSFACSCAPFNVDENYQKARYVFEGYVTKSKVIFDVGKSNPWGLPRSNIVVANYQVSKSWKGDPNELDGIATQAQSSACGMQLAAGQSYTFFVYSEWVDKSMFSEERYGVVSFCGSPSMVNYEQYNSTMEWLKSRN